MALPDCTMTTKGRALVAKAIAGQNIQVTRWQIGTGVLSTGNEADLTALINPLKYVAISSATNTGVKATIQGQFTNEGMDAFEWEELGLWAVDPDEGEILFAVAEARGNGDHIGGWSQKVHEFIFGMELTLSETANVSAVIAEGMLFATKEELNTVLSRVSDAEQSVVDITALVNASKTFFMTFELSDWGTSKNSDGCYELRIAQSVHGMQPKRPEISYTLMVRYDRSALDCYGSYGCVKGKDAIVKAIQAAIAAGYETDPTYGYPILTWYQLQYYMLDEILVTDAEAQTKAAERGFDWKEYDITGAKATCTLDDILRSGYTVALGGSSAQLDTYATEQNLQGLRLRRRDDDVEPNIVEKYDLHGRFTEGMWGLFECGVRFDTTTKEIVITSWEESSTDTAGDSLFAGSLMVNA